MLTLDPELSRLIKLQMQELDLITLINNTVGEAKFITDRSSFLGNYPPAQITNFVYWYRYNKNNLGVDLELPFDDYKWWISETRPGQFLPMHYEPDVMESEDNTVRYWVPLQDYIPGHIFIMDDVLIKDYKAGDVYKWDDPKSFHGAVNITNLNRLTLQIGVGGNYNRGSYVL